MYATSMAKDTTSPLSLKCHSDFSAIKHSNVKCYIESIHQQHNFSPFTIFLEDIHPGSCGPTNFRSRQQLRPGI